MSVSGAGVPVGVPGVGVPGVSAAGARVVRTRRRPGRLMALAAAGVLTVGLATGGAALGVGSSRTESSQVAVGGTTTAERPGPGILGGSGGRPGGSWAGGSPADDGSSAAATGTTAATDAQQAGVVLITTTLGYESAEAAGTGIVLTSDGLVLTNNHVVEGSTEISVTVPATGQSYTATIVGTDSTHDVAVLQLADASGPATATLDDDGDVAAGDTVTAVGNAEGGGTLVAADGTVTALDESITTSSSGGSEGEALTGLIEIDADVVSGDSGGPLLDDEGEVVGMTTAASSGSADITGYAIPIEDALDVATDIIAGNDTDTITLGYPAFLGVELAASGSAGSTGSLSGPATGFGGRDSAGGSGTLMTTSGATIAGVISGTPAAEAGLTAGDVVTAVDGAAVASGDELSAALAAKAPGDQVTITWTDAQTGTAQSATVTLIEGPAD
ncbi:S1C family serine protease [Cellulomonas hominis]